MADAADVVALMRASEFEVLGRAFLGVDDVIGHWQRPSLDLGRDTLGVLDESGRLLAFAEVYSGHRAEVNVDASVRGRGIGTALLHWTWAKAREAGVDSSGQTVPADDSGAVTLLERNAYTLRWTSWILERKLAGGPLIPVGGASAPRPMRAGEERVVFQVIEDAFNEWPNRDRSNFEDWSATTIQRPDAEPWHLQVVAHDDEIVGVATLAVSGTEGWVEHLAVRKDRRGEGWGRVLLSSAFAEFQRRGLEAALLSTDSRTGALGLYLHVGMTVVAEYVRLAAPISPGTMTP